MSRRESVIAVLDEVLVAVALVVLTLYGAYSFNIIGLRTLIILLIISISLILLYAYKMAQAQVEAVKIGPEALIGSVGEAIDDIDDEGYVMIEGEIWKARSTTGRIPRGARVRIVGFNGLVLEVEPVRESRVSLRRGEG